MFVSDKHLYGGVVCVPKNGSRGYVVSSTWIWKELGVILKWNHVFGCTILVSLVEKIERTRTRESDTAYTTYYTMAVVLAYLFSLVVALLQMYHGGRSVQFHI